MDGSCKGGSGGGSAGDDKPNPDTLNPSPSSPPPPPSAADGDHDAASAAAAGGRRPFTSLSQEEADLALARLLQEQERAYMMLTGQGAGGYAAFDGEGYEYYDDDDDYEHGDGEDEEDVSDYEEDEEEGEGGEAVVGDAEAEAEAGLDLDLDHPARYDDDEVAGRLSAALAGIGDWRAMEQGDDGEEEDRQDAWEDIDPDEYSYEELIALGEVVGTESKGLPADTIASLPSVTYQAQDKQDGNMEQCVICRVELEEGESLVGLPCKHSYHSECINHWLQLNKVCPMCSAEVSASVDKKASEVPTSENKKA